MNFELTEKQKVVRTSVRKFAEEVLGPTAPIVDREANFSWAVKEELEKINAWGISIPEKYGGAGLDSISNSIVIEELARVCASTSLTVTVHNSVAAYPIYKFGNKFQKEKYLVDLATGKKIGAFSLSEANAGSDVTSIETMAIQNGENFIVNGSKIYVTNGGVADISLVGAKYVDTDNNKGFAIFIMEKDMPGYEIGEPEDKMGMRGSSTTALYFDSVRVPKENVLGSLKDGFKIVMQTLDAGRIGIAAQALGIAQAAFELAADYSLHRVQFGRPISKFQGVSFKIAEMATKIDNARLLTYRASWLKDQNKPYSKEAAMCKYYSSMIAREVCQEAIQIYGGYGYSKDLPLERFYRDVKITEIYEGTNEIMKLIIATQVLKSL